MIRSKHHPIKMYLTQLLITSAGTTVFFNVNHNRGRDVCAFKPERHW